MTKKDIFEIAIIEMGNRVGLQWKSFEDALAYQVENGLQWYLTQTWTLDDQADFEQWLTALCKRHGWSDYKAIRETAFFIMSYGWRVER
jgi:hypothetical protein